MIHPNSYTRLTMLALTLAGAGSALCAKDQPWDEGLIGAKLIEGATLWTANGIVPIASEGL